MKLRGCPGGHSEDDAMVIGGPGTAAGPQFWVGCRLCRWRTIGDTEAEAVDLWNTRKDPQ